MNLNPLSAYQVKVNVKVMSEGDNAAVHFIFLSVEFRARPRAARQAPGLCRYLATYTPSVAMIIDSNKRCFN
jgi:hypothetical protein